MDRKVYALFATGEVGGAEALLGRRLAELGDVYEVAVTPVDADRAALERLSPADFGGAEVADEATVLARCGEEVALLGNYLLAVLPESLAAALRFPERSRHAFFDLEGPADLPAPGGGPR